MQTFIEKANELCADASVAAMALLNEAGDDMELLPLVPRKLPDAELAEMFRIWRGRGLRSVGVVGLCGTTPRCALKEPLPEQQAEALGAAFGVYLSEFLFEGLMRQREGVEVSELCRVWWLEDPRTDLYTEA